MTKRLYLHRKRERLYFRRRIPGLSTSTAPVSLALGMTDAALGHMWAEHLSQEFDRMLEQFIFMSPPLPEHLVARYFESCLAEILLVLQRNLRLARMSGRISEAYLPNREIQALVLQSLVEDGVNRYLPAKRVDPAWTTSQLDLAVRIYAHEAREILSREHDNKLAAGFGEHSDLPLLSLEHKAQLREAYLSARLVALRTFQLEKPSHERALSSLTEKPDGHVTVRPPESHGSKGGGAGLSQETPFKMENTESPAEVRSDVEAGKGPAMRAVNTRTRSVLTISTLLPQYRESSTTAQDDGPGGYSSELPDLFYRMAETDSLTKDVMRQRASDLRLFSLITGVTDVTVIEQADLTFWCDTLRRFPTHFLKSSKDQDRTIDEIVLIARSLPKEQRGLHPETIRRHIKSLELVIERASAEGHTLRNLDFGKLKPKKTARNRAHRRRSVFREDEARKVFAHPVWQGCKSGGRRHDPGSLIVKDALFWIPTILAYTGATRAEIAGLTVADFEEHEGISCIVVRSNAFRGVKGDPEDPYVDDLTRVVPIHSHLLELGLLDHVMKTRSAGSQLAFPDVVPKATQNSRLQDPQERALAVEKFGESIDYMWRKAVKIALDANPRKLCMHSLRHYVNHSMIHTPGIHEVTRFDLLGHVEDDDNGRKNGRTKTSINTSVYRDDTSVTIKRAAIETLPRLF